MLMMPSELPEKIVIQLVTTEEQLARVIGDLIDRKLDQLAVLTPSPDQEEEELLSIEQIASFFQVTQTTIHNWKKQGILPYIKVNSRIRFGKSAVLMLYEKQRKHRSK